MKKITLVCFVIIGFVVSGCASMGSDFDMNYVDKIEKGVTTEQDVLNNLGTPQTTGTQLGNKFFGYTHSEASVSPVSMIPVIGLLFGGSKASVKTLTISFDENGTVSDYTTSASDSNFNHGILN